MLKFLSLSDIHNNLQAINFLRNYETNSYDCIIVAGDIGNDIADDFFAVMDTFECPVYCVYGNWDNKQPYRRKLSQNCILLDGFVENLSGYHVAGFSGCPTHWGQNPIYAKEVAAVVSRHPRVLDRLNTIKAESVAALAELIPQHAEKSKALIRDFDTSQPDNEELLLRSIRSLKFQLDQSRAKIKLIKENYRATPEFAAYAADMAAAVSKALTGNRAKLISVIKDSEVAMDRLILVTHERLTKLAEDGLTPAVHIFGHRHGFKLTTIKGIHYLNTSQTDSVLGSDIHACQGGYVRVTLGDTQARDISVERVHLPFWNECVPGSSYDGTPTPNFR